MGTLIQDLRYGLRMLARNPGFTAVAVLTLALGIGANTAIFSLIDAVMLKSLPVRDPSRIVLFNWTAHKHWNGSIETSSFGDCSFQETENPSGCTFPYPYFELIRSNNNLFSGAAAFAGPAAVVLSGNGPARLAEGELVSGDYFTTLGVAAALGRTLGPEDDLLSASPAVVLSYGFWQSAFGGDRSVIGRTIELNRIPFVIVGVTAPGFNSLSPGKAQDFFVSLSVLPLNIDWAKNSRTLRNWWLVIVARLRTGMTLENAQAAASLAFRNEMVNGEKPLSKPSDDPRVVLVPVQQGLTGDRGEFSTALYVLMAAAGMVLLIACANVAGLLVSRSAARQKEIAVRLSLGAPRLRILRQLLTESVLVSFAGGALGVLFAYWGVHAITSLIMAGSKDPFPFAVEPDWRLLAFALVVSVSAGILSGFAPALRSTKLDLTPGLKENISTRPEGARRFRLGNLLVAVQAALSIIALIGAGLLVRTLQNLRNVNPGFDTRNILLFGIDPTLAKYTDSQIQNLYRELRERFAALPGVISTSYSSDALLSGGLWTETVRVEDQPKGMETEVDMLAAGPDFFKTMRIPLLEGQMFASEDFSLPVRASEPSESSQKAGSASTPSPVAKPSAAPNPPIHVLVNARFVHEFFPKMNPLGKQLTEGGSSGASGDDVAVGKPRSKRWQIVGVVGDAKYNSVHREIHPMVYVPLMGGGAYFELRAASDPAALVPAVREVVRRVDSNLPIFGVKTQTESIERLLSKPRVIAQLSTFFAGLALVLACIGLYGLLSYEITRRTREIGIRMALGAEKSDVLRMVVGQGLKLALIGVAIGIAGALALTRFLSSLLYGVKPTDPLTFVAVSLILIIVALLACYIPARRAAKVDPMVALRYE
ncbi:MAG TPA: ABC transporter permease [Terriglobia bacterium]|nr:ABC transporter permease [Terriglobia bacterium]